MTEAQEVAKKQSIGIIKYIRNVRLLCMYFKFDWIEKESDNEVAYYNALNEEILEWCKTRPEFYDCYYKRIGNANAIINSGLTERSFYSKIHRYREEFYKHFNEREEALMKIHNFNIDKEAKIVWKKYVFSENLL